MTSGSQARAAQLPTAEPKHSEGWNVKVGGCQVGIAMVLALALAACGQTKSPAEASLPDSLRWHGMYISDTLPSLGGDVARVAHLAVGPDTQAIMTIEFVQRGTIFRRGIWWANKAKLTFEPRRGDGTPAENVFVWRLDGQRLVPVEWDRELHGVGGIPLTKQPPVAPLPPADTNSGANR